MRSAHTRRFVWAPDANLVCRTQTAGTRIVADQRLNRPHRWFTVGLACNDIVRPSVLVTTTLAHGTTARFLLAVRSHETQMDRLTILHQVGSASIAGNFLENDHD